MRDTKETLVEQLDRLSPAQFTRAIDVGEPPPAAPPTTGYVWNEYRGLWEESDAQLRARLTYELASEVGCACGNPVDETRPTDRPGLCAGCRFDVEGA